MRSSSSDGCSHRPLGFQRNFGPEIHLELSTSSLAVIPHEASSAGLDFCFNVSPLAEQGLISNLLDTVGYEYMKSL